MLGSKNCAESCCGKPQQRTSGTGAVSGHTNETTVRCVCMHYAPTRFSSYDRRGQVRILLHTYSDHHRDSLHRNRKTAQLQKSRAGPALMARPARTDTTDQRSLRVPHRPT